MHTSSEHISKQMICILYLHKYFEKLTKIPPYEELILVFQNARSLGKQQYEKNNNNYKGE